VTFLKEIEKEAQTVLLRLRKRATKLEREKDTEREG
jgi:hypothetical protein